MKRLKLLILCLTAGLATNACDPVFVRSIDVESPQSGAVAPFPLSDVDSLAESLEFMRAEPPADSREALESQGYELVAYYERTEPESSNMEWLAISEAPGGRSYQLSLFAFVAMGEPAKLGEFREALTSMLCDSGYFVEGVDDCGN